jgi:PAS domain S-box-containing protein
MQSVNEELQSSNEELETAKEELQSSNEELHTVNSELQLKVMDLAQANNDINNLLVGTGIGTLFVDHQLRILRFTPPVAGIINVTPEDAGRPLNDFTTRLKKYSTLAEDVRAVLQTLVPTEREVQAQDKWYLLRILPYRTTENVIEGAVLSFLDITGHKRGQEKAERLAAIVENSSDAIIGKDLDGIITTWNRGAEKMFGYTASEMVGTPVLRLIPDDRRQEEQDILGKIKSGESVEHFETLRQTKDGRLLDVSLTASPIRDADGTVVGASKVARDITANKKAQADLVESDKFYRLLLESMSGFAYCRMIFEDTQPKDFVYLMVNKSFEEQTGLKDVCGKRVSEVIPGVLEKDRQLIEIYGRVAMSGQAERCEYFLKSLEMWLSLLVYSPQPGCFVVVFDVITERKRLEAKLRASEERFRLVAQTTNDLIYEFDLKNDVQWFGDIDKLLGYAPGEFPRTMDGWMAAVHPDDRDAVTAAIQSHMENRADYAIECRVIRKDGNVLWVSDRGLVTRTPEGVPLRWIGSITKITEKKRPRQTPDNIQRPTSTIQP